MRHTRVQLPRADYFVYGVVFESDGNATMLRGMSRSENHADLLTRNGSIQHFEKANHDFVLGRIRPYTTLGLVVADVGSDLYTAKTGIRDPLDVLEEARRHRFERCLASGFAESRVYVLAGGIDRRVPSLNERRLKQWMKMIGNAEPCPLREIFSP